MSVNDKLLSLKTILNDGVYNSFNCEAKNVTSLLLKELNIILIDSAKTENLSFNASNETEPATAENDYDYQGALAYIFFILFWYSLFIIALVVIQTKKSALEYYEDSDDPQELTARNVLKRIRTGDVKREALEDLRNLHFRQKMWDIYLDNPNSYKIRRFESKRIHQIDRKLKQYYNEKGDSNKDSKDYYKTIDLSQLDRNKAKYENATFLLKDVSKFEQSNTIHPNASLNKDSKSQHVNLNNIWNNQGNNNNIKSNYANNNSGNPSLNLTSNRNSFNISNTNANNVKSNDSNRFKIEKIKDIV